MGITVNATNLCETENSTSLHLSLSISFNGLNIRLSVNFVFCPFLFVTSCAGGRPWKLTFDFLTLKVVSESRVTWATSMPILVFL